MNVEGKAEGNAFFTVPGGSVLRVAQKACRINCRILGAIRNVWSAAVLQAKDEEDGIGLRECIRPLLE